MGDEHGLCLYLEHPNRDEWPLRSSNHRQLSSCPKKCCRLNYSQCSLQRGRSIQQDAEDPEQGIYGSHFYHYVPLLLLTLRQYVGKLVRAKERGWNFTGNGHDLISHTYTVFLRVARSDSQLLSNGSSNWNRCGLYHTASIQPILE